ncbi:MAG: DUF5666 domain-containing protein [Burkholderiales bacterium]|nr:DUF5666 domain-containing protein [Burkholderiales bacterium]
MNKNTKIIIFIVLEVLLLSAIFYSGMYWKENKKSTQNIGMYGEGMQNKMGPNGLGKNIRNINSGFVNGEIISKDDKSITLKIINLDPKATTENAGSKIIFFDTNTSVSKTATGTFADLSNGTQVSISGITNSDGSMTAKSIQIRPQTKINTPAQ